MTFSQVTLFLFTNLHYNQTLKPEEFLIVVDLVAVADMVEEVHMVGVEEEEISNLTAKVGKFIHLLSLLLPKRKILLHFLTRHNKLNILQTKTLSKVSYVILKDN